MNYSKRFIALNNPKEKERERERRGGESLPVLVIGKNEYEAF